MPPRSPACARPPLRTGSAARPRAEGRAADRRDRLRDPAVDAAHPSRPPILRVKGILDLAGAARPVAVHGVQHRVHPSMDRAAWPEGRRPSRLALIVDGSEEARIRTSFAVLVRLR
ncbi:GTP-binding protein [Methylorubrum populi]|uniref:GTP-binding protein n=1 Tax=Methylorubrum populi TaxID=223967 RepID=UPI001152FC9F|nr:GTP-binding protein [Methylorubrum populi]